MCHTGERSRELVNELEKEGYPAINVSGGYRAFLRYQLSHFPDDYDMMDKNNPNLRDK